MRLREKTPDNLGALLDTLIPTWPLPHLTTRYWPAPARLLKHLAEDGVREWNTLDLTVIDDLLADIYEYPSFEEGLEGEELAELDEAFIRRHPITLYALQDQLPDYAGLPIVCLTTVPFY